MNKSELRTGDLCTIKGKSHSDGGVVRVFLGTDNGDIVSGDTWFPLKDYSDDKLFVLEDGFIHITAVWRPRSNMNFKDNVPSASTHTLIWQKQYKTETEKQLDSVMQKLEELQEEAKNLKEIVRKEKA